MSRESAENWCNPNIIFIAYNCSLSRHAQPQFSITPQLGVYWLIFRYLVRPCSVTKWFPTLCDPMDCMQHNRLPCPPLSPRVCTNSCPLSHWCHPTIKSSIIPVFTCPQSFPASSSFPMSQLFTSGDQSIGASASASVLQYSGLNSFRIDWFDLLAVQGTLRSLLQHNSSKASILCCSAFFMVQLSPLYITAGKTIVLTIWPMSAKWCLCFLICCQGWS